MALRVPSKSEIGQRLRWLRKQAGISGRALAYELTGKIDPSLVPEMEKGDRLDHLRLMELANIFAGRGDLSDDSEKIFDFIHGRIPASDVMHPRPLGGTSDGILYLRHWQVDQGIRDLHAVGQ